MSDDPGLNLEESHPQGRPARRVFPRRAVRWAVRNWLPILLVIVVGAPTVLLALGLNWLLRPSRPTLDASRVESVTVRLGKYEPEPDLPPGYAQQPAEVTTNDPALIQPMLDVFRAARRAEDHNCGNSGIITVRRTNGTVQELRILPGHNDRYYEYRLGSRINRVPREPFLAALRAMGLTEVKTVPP